jgi:hypothetical protein
MRSILSTWVIIVLVCMGMTTQARDIKINSVELGQPVPSIPFYHIRVAMELPERSFMEAEMSVNGKTLRFLDLYTGNENEDPKHPHVSHRPPSGFGLSQDNTLYLKPEVIGWVNWMPGQSYTVKVTIRMKKSVKSTSTDEIITATRTVTAPQRDISFDRDWKRYKSVVVSETAGVDRTGEAVKVLLPFYPDEAKDLKREIRVVAVDPVTFKHKEVPVQVFDVQEYTKEDDLAPDKNGKPTRDIPIWLPTVTAQVAFLADVPARSSKVFLIYYNNEQAMVRSYATDLKVSGESPGLRMDNDQMEVDLHPQSGHFDQVTLKALPNFPLFHRKETNGAIHWNPEVYTPPLPWTHTSDWKPAPHTRSITGPVLATAEMWGPLREIPQVDCSVRYEFYPGRPYFISSTTMRINETIQSIALRNAEVVIKRELMTHASWYDVMRDSIVTYNVKDMTDLTDLKMEADIPWIAFYNKENGLGFAGIQMNYSNAGLENDPRLLNPYFYITAGPWIYWARALSLSFLASNMQQMIPVMKGNFFAEKWAYLVYKIDDPSKPFEKIKYWEKVVNNPLRTQLVEEVDERVSRTVTELFVEKGKSGWEGRETGRNHKND